MAKHENNLAIKKFKEYLQIPSVQPNVNYDDCVTFLKKYAEEIGLQVKVYEVVPRKPIIILTWNGNSSLPSILLNSHMDVVPVFENISYIAISPKQLVLGMLDNGYTTYLLYLVKVLKKSWSYPPFSGHTSDDGKIYGRGSQDMKCVSIQYLEAIRNLMQSNIQPKRTIHLSFVPDEETGGHDGMKKFVHTMDFKQLNVGFALDEGLASPTEEFIIFNDERSIWQIHVHCSGQPGHGSLLFPNTAGDKLRYIIDKFMDLRKEQTDLLESNRKLTVADVTTINLTQVYGGVQANVIPEKMSAVFDIRLATTVDHQKFENMINQWCSEAGNGVTIEFEQKNPYVESTKLDNSNPFWLAFKKATDDMNLKLVRKTLPGGTDVRYVRQVGVPAIGFSPMNNTPVLLHDNDEYLHTDVFIKGIEIYEKIIEAVANV